MAIRGKKWKFWNLLLRRWQPLWCQWRSLCGFRNFEKNSKFWIFFCKFENYGEFWKITKHNFQSRRQILTLGGVYCKETRCFQEKFTQLEMFLHARRSWRWRQISRLYVQVQSAKHVSGVKRRWLRKVLWFTDPPLQGKWKRQRKTFTLTLAFICFSFFTFWQVPASSLQSYHPCQAGLSTQHQSLADHLLDILPLK